MRPHQLDFAMRPARRQQDVELQLVLARTASPPTEDAGQAAGWARRRFVLLDFDEDAFFGDVLNDAARAAVGDVLLKIDDDDWYSPHAVHDLLLARRFTGADVVGMPTEFVYLEEDGVTVRRNHPSETYNRFVAGGTIMIDRRCCARWAASAPYAASSTPSCCRCRGGRWPDLPHARARLRASPYRIRPHLAVDDDQFRRAEITERSGPASTRASEMRGATDAAAARRPPQRLERAHPAGAGGVDADQERQRRHAGVQLRRTLPFVLAGLAAQTYPPHLMEVVVVDDQSTPPLDPARRAARQHPASCVTESGWGRANACHHRRPGERRRGLHWLDADMLAHREHVEAQLRWHHLIDYAVPGGDKRFVDPASLADRAPAEVRDVVAAGGAGDLFPGEEHERTPGSRGSGSARPISRKPVPALSACTSA